jgi:hypothetical protein
MLTVESPDVRGVCTRNSINKPLILAFQVINDRVLFSVQILEKTASGDL